MTKTPMDTKDIKVNVETRFLNKETLQKLFIFSKDELINNKESIKSNTLTHPMLLSYYLKAVNNWR